jgi:hypothetical protein
MRPWIPPDRRRHQCAPERQGAPLLPPRPINQQF